MWPAAAKAILSGLLTAQTQGRGAGRHHDLKSACCWGRHLSALPPSWLFVRTLLQQESMHVAITVYTASSEHGGIVRGGAVGSKEARGETCRGRSMRRSRQGYAPAQPLAASCASSCAAVFSTLARICASRCRARCIRWYSASGAKLV